MIIEETLDMLEWGKVLERLVSLCATDAGASCVSRMTFHTDPGLIKQLLEENRQMRALLVEEKPPVIRDLPVLQNELEEAEAGATLPVETAVVILKAIRTTEGLRKYFRERKGKYPAIAARARSLSDLSSLKSSLEEKIDYDGEIKDSASPQLPILRKRAETARSRVVDTANAILSNPAYHKHLQDSYVTIRSGRHALPFKPSAKGTIRGILHETSQSGQTIFFEPEELVHANNELKSAESELALEIQRIMRQISIMIGDLERDITPSIEGAAGIDWIQARSLLAEEMSAQEPVVKDNGSPEIISARNPLLLLGMKQAVPNSVSMSGKRRCMIVTGPNAGGKTVLIKTIGLLTLMTMAGLSIPADPDTRITVFPKIFIAMGDMQSVEKDLSTFSADILTMKNFYEEADDKTLILLDEVITGTDPKEGTALGQAYLKALMDRGAIVFVTTHFDEIKYLPFEDDRFTVASMGFSDKDLTPTFQLTMGVPGRSMGIEIAKKIGFPEPIIENAKKYMGTKEQKVDDLIKELSVLRDREAAAVEKLSRERARLRELIQKRKQERAQIREMEKDVMDKARAKSIKTVRDAEEEVEKIMEELRREKKVEVVRKAKDVISRIKREAGEGEVPEEIRKIISRTKPVAKAGDLVPGQRIFVVSLGKEGHVESSGEGKSKVTVSLGAVKSSVHIRDIRIYGSEVKKGERSARERKIPGQEAGTPFVRCDDNTIDVRGLDQEETIKEVDLFLDRAAMADIPSILIIHGHGTGTLKKAIREYLRRSLYVDEFSPASKEQGGDGATIVKLR